MPIAEVLNALLITYIATEYSISSSSSSTGTTTSSTKPSNTTSSSSSSSRSDQNHADGPSFSSSSSSSSCFSVKTFLSARHNQIILIVVLVVNLMDKFVLAQNETVIFARQFFERLLHAPKIVLAALLYIILLYIDCVRHLQTLNNKALSSVTKVDTNAKPKKTVRQILPIRRFLKCVGVKFLTILPVYPLLAVLISFFFMVIISLLEHLHLPLQWLNWPIYYGTLYGPFSLVYFQVKETIIEEWRYFIPTTTRGNTLGSAGVVFNDHRAGLFGSRGETSRRYARNNDTSLRKSRLAYFNVKRITQTSTSPGPYYCSNDEILSYRGEYVSFHGDHDDGNNDGNNDGGDDESTHGIDCPV